MIGGCIMNLYWIIQAVAYWALVFFIVPGRFIPKVFVFAYLGGFLYTWTVQLIGVGGLRLWQFTPDPLTLWGIPVFFVMSWFAVTLIFGYLLLIYPAHQLWIVAFFVLWGTIMSYVALTLNQLAMIRWSVAETFMFALFSHVLLLYVFKYMHYVDELGSKEDMIKFSLAALKRR